MKKPKKQSRNVLSVRTIPSNSTIPRSSAYPSENDEERAKALKLFRFFDLPSELRNRIYELHFASAPSVIDLDPDNFMTIYRKFPLFFVSKRTHEEASHYFYSTRTVRIFPTHPGRFFKTKRPLLARLPRHYRSSITSLQLRLGPGFSNPPVGWVVNDGLGLKDATSVRVLKVFVEVDTSNPIFRGFRNAVDGFYEKFSSQLLDRVLHSLSSVPEVQFDAYPSVCRDGEMMTGLIDVALQHGKLISWGPDRGWNEENNDSGEKGGSIAPNIFELPMRALKVIS